MLQSKTYTGYRRKLRTRWRVRATENVARVLIGLGGMGTIVAVFGVCIFLAWVVVPLLLPGSAEPRTPGPVVGWSGDPPIRLDVDEYRVLAWALRRDGALLLLRLDTGEVIEERRLLDGDRLTAWAFLRNGGHLAFGFDDGSIRLGRIAFETRFIPSESASGALRSLEDGAIATHEGGVVQNVGGALRAQSLLVEIGEPIPGRGSPVVLVDRVVRASDSILCVLTADGALRLDTVAETENLFTGEVAYDVRSSELPYRETSREGAAWPAHLLVSEAATAVFTIWEDGRLVRWDTRDLEAPRVAEELDLVADPEATVTAFNPLIGRSTLVVGDSGGAVTGWFLANRESDGGTELVRARAVGEAGAPVTQLASSARSRVVAAGRGDGSISVHHVTSETTVAEVSVPAGESMLAMTMAPKDDGVVALTSSGLRHWDLDLRHPEASPAALCLPVWYEGYPGPAHVWQSTGGTDDFEPKFGLWPLVFGTLKATFYSLLFGVPIALLAAIFTSEFLPRSLGTRVKTLIELMAGLPSVVLGFLAGLVIAPFVQDVLPATLLSFLVLPAVFLGGAYLWQLLPNELAVRFARWRLAAVVALVPIAIAASAWLGPVMEHALFTGDIKGWLDGVKGSGFGGWVWLLVPACAGVVALGISRFVTPWIRGASAGWPRGKLARVELVKFLAGAGATVVLAVALGGALTALGCDPRGDGSIIDTYVQRNALVVGFIMGFAIIPIIYTIAEDALSSVPEHLRAASLGAGATPWQTAIRIVLPTAMSGLFSAVMIGLGRAVGETMIVLMAAGNTPVLEMNIFNGFRTLSANIAVELPEAVRDSTHYRTLFLAALLLFLMTFVVNTAAEVVRLRFRKRAHQL
jgi:phosphate transport system permease protein